MKRVGCLLMLVIILTQTAFISHAETVTNEKEIAVLTESDLQEYFADSVLVGDSVALGYANYAKANKDSIVGKMIFLTEGGFGASNAMKPLEQELNPTYKGKRQYIWDSIAETGAKRVFLSYGINDLVPLNKRIYSQYEEVVNKILEKSPDIDINIVSITPVFSEGEYGRINNEHIDEVNAKLKEIASEKGWGFLDVASKLKGEDGSLAADYCSDGYVHLNKSTYPAVWNPVFEQFAEEDLSEDGYIFLKEEAKVILTTVSSELYAVPDAESESLLTVPADTEIISKGVTSNDMYLLDLGDGTDYYIKTENAKVE